MKRVHLAAEKRVNYRYFTMWWARSSRPCWRPPRGDDEEAFSVLWRDANPALLRYLRVVTPEHAEDVAAETWVQVVRGLAHVHRG